MNIIAHNLLAMNAQRQLGIHSNSKIKTAEKMSSGYKINRAADDAAGLSVSEKMRRQIRGLTQASENIVDGISFVQVADGAINEVHDILQRMNELSVKAANGTYTDTDRMYIQEELDQLTMECDRIFKETEFNEQKIWQAPYIPYVTGIPRELKIYNETMDANGNITFGGIIWGNERYTWNEIDPGLYDSATGKFNPGTYTIDVPAVKLNPATDLYDEVGNTISLNITVSEEGLLTSISRECGWSANENGITMDGVLYEWKDLEDATHNKTFNPNNIQAGNWGFNTYNGTHIWFEIPEGTTELSEVIDGINGSILDNLSWETHITSIQSDFAVGIVYGEDAAVLTAPTIEINNDTFDKITGKYYLHADEANGVWITNENALDLGKKLWQKLGLESGTGEFLPPHNFTNHIYYEYPATGQPDNHATVTNGAYFHYTEGSQGYQSTVIPGLSVQFMVLEEAGKQGIINGIDGVVIDTQIHTPSKASVISLGTMPQNVTVSVESASTVLSFDVHKEMARDFNDASALIGSGSLEVESNDLNDLQAKIVLNVTNNKSPSQTITFETERTNGEIQDDIQRLLMGNSGSLSLELKDEFGNKVNLSYQVSALPDNEKQAAFTDGGKLKDYTQGVLVGIMGGAVILEADGAATQTIGKNRNGVDSLGFADRKNNKASYANFGTRIKYTRELNIQAGAEAGEHIKIRYDVLNASILGLVNVSVMDASSAGASIGLVKEAIAVASEQRSLFGSYQNRLEHTRKSNDNAAENTISAESRIRDADMAKDATQNAMKNVLLQAGQSVLAQANQNNTTILNLLQ